MGGMPSVHIVHEKPLFGKPLISGALASVVGIGIDAYASARSEQSGHLYVFGSMSLMRSFMMMFTQSSWKSP